VCSRCAATRSHSYFCAAGEPTVAVPVPSLPETHAWFVANIYGCVFVQHDAQHEVANDMHKSRPALLQAGTASTTRDGITMSDNDHSSVSTKVTPVSPPEAASWSVVIALAYAFTASLAYMVVTQLFMQTPEAAAFDAALARVRNDFRVTVRLGDNIKGA
jgi:hypothetical protein